MNKLNKYQKIFVFSILVVAAIALLDIFSMNSGVFGTASNYVQGNYTAGWWNLFFKINLVMIVLISLAYYFFGKKDKSESLALFVSSLTLWMVFGLADLLFFWFQGQSVPSVLTWLNGSYIGKLLGIIGFSQVTNIGLYLAVAIGLIVNYFLIKYLVEKL